MVFCASWLLTFFLVYAKIEHSLKRGGAKGETYAGNILFCGWTEAKMAYWRVRWYSYIIQKQKPRQNKSKQTKHLRENSFIKKQTKNPHNSIKKAFQKRGIF